MYSSILRLSSHGTSQVEPRLVCRGCLCWHPMKYQWVSQSGCSCSLASLHYATGVPCMKGQVVMGKYSVQTESWCWDGLYFLLLFVIFLTVSFKLIISACTRPFAAYSQTHFSGGTTPKLPLPMGIQAPIQYIVPGAYPSTQPEWQLSSWLCLVSDTDANTERPLYILLYIMRTFLQNTTSCISLCDFFHGRQGFLLFSQKIANFAQLPSVNFRRRWRILRLVLLSSVNFHRRYNLWYHNSDSV